LLAYFVQKFPFPSYVIHRGYSKERSKAKLGKCCINRKYASAFLLYNYHKSSKLRSTKTGEKDNRIDWKSKNKNKIQSQA